MSDRRVAILGGGLYRPGRVRYDNAEEGVAMAYRNMLQDFSNLDPREIEFVQSSYFSDHLNQGAHKLVDPGVLRERLPNEDVPLITLGHIGHQGERAGDTADSGAEGIGEGDITPDTLEEEEPAPEPPRY